MASPGPYRVIRRVLNDVENYNMIVVFFPGFDRFIPGFDRLTPPVSTDSSLLAFLLPPPPPPPPPRPPTIQMHISQSNVHFLYFEITLFHLIWHKYLLSKKTFINCKNKYFCWKNKVDTNPRLPLSHWYQSTYGAPESWDEVSMYCLGSIEKSWFSFQIKR